MNGEQEWTFDVAAVTHCKQGVLFQSWPGDCWVEQQDLDDGRSRGQPVYCRIQV